MPTSHLRNNGGGGGGEQKKHHLSIDSFKHWLTVVSITRPIQSKGSENESRITTMRVLNNQCAELNYQDNS